MVFQFKLKNSYVTKDKSKDCFKKLTLHSINLKLIFRLNL